MTNKKPLLAAVQETHFVDSGKQRYRFALFAYSLYNQNINSTPRRGGSALYVFRNQAIGTLQAEMAQRAVAHRSILICPHSPAVPL